ncbi:hypothetical protein ACWERE_44585, partial [Rhodococcus koreensis]
RIPIRLSNDENARAQAAAQHRRPAHRNLRSTTASPTPSTRIAVQRGRANRDPRILPGSPRPAKLHDNTPSILFPIVTINGVQFLRIFT